MRLLDLLIKGAGHKYIKRIPVGTTKTGKVRYRYIYSATHTVGGKHLLDEAHLKPGTKLMLHSKDGAEVHAHIESVKGDQVTFTYDDGERKGETRTVSKQQLLAEFNKEHKVGEQIDSAKAALLADIRAAGEKGFSKKQLARLVARLERLGGSVDKEDGRELPKLAKDLLAKHQVNKEQVNKALRHWQKSTAKSESNPDVMYMRRLQRLERDGIERAVDTYNRALDQAAQDNAQLLAAMERYRELINPYNDPEQLNRLTQRRIEAYQDTIDFIKAFDKQAYAEVDRGALTYEAIRKESGARFADIMARATFRKTGIDIKKTKQTIQEAFTQLHPEDSLAAAFERNAADTPEAKALALEIEEQVKDTCGAFLFANSKYSAGDVHTNHEIAVTNKLSLEYNRLKETAHTLAHVEDVILRAYPTRDKHTTRLKPSTDKRASANPGENYSSIFCQNYSSLKTRVHELAHTLEGRSTTKGVLASEAALTHKTKADRDAPSDFTSNGYACHADYQLAIQEAVTLTHLTRIEQGKHSTYTTTERTYDDNYHDVYAGKIYAAGSSELVTMGVQEMFSKEDSVQQITNIANFARRDPHHFLVTYAILKGYTKHES